MALFTEISGIDQSSGGMEHRIVELDRRPFEVPFPTRGLGATQIRLSGFEFFCGQ